MIKNMDDKIKVSAMAEILIAYNNGEKIEQKLKSVTYIWGTNIVWEYNPNPTFNFEKYDYRIREKIKQKYRVALFYSDTPNVYGLYFALNEQEALSLEGQKQFHRWDTDWKEIS